MTGVVPGLYAPPPLGVSERGRLLRRADRARRRRRRAVGRSPRRGVDRQRRRRPADRDVARVGAAHGDVHRRPRLLDAGAATRQLRLAIHGVLYLHGGWASLVDGLADVVRAAGGQIRTRAAVAAVEHDARVRSVRLADGTTIAADAVVVAVNDPRRVAGAARRSRRDGRRAGHGRRRPRAHGPPRRRPAPAPRTAAAPTCSASTSRST